MVNLTILIGTWKAQRAEISRLCDVLDAVEESQRDGVERQIIRLVDEVGHLHAMIAEARNQGHIL